MLLVRPFHLKIQHFLINSTFFCRNLTFLNAFERFFAFRLLSSSWSVLEYPVVSVRIHYKSPKELTKIANTLIARILQGCLTVRAIATSFQGIFRSADYDQPSLKIREAERLIRDIT